MRVRFDSFTLDSGTRQLRREGAHVHLTPKAFDLLCVLIEHRPNVVSKGDLHARIWPAVAVTDASLNVAVREIRQVLGDDGAQQRLVRTVARVGYAFCGNAVDVDALPAVASVPSAPRSCWLVWQTTPLPLSDGENIIGRGAGCDVQVDDDAVSRRHANVRIDSAARRATIEDLDSMNGTYRGRTRVKTRELLTDGDTIKLGTVALKVRLWSKGDASETTRVRRSK